MVLCVCVCVCVCVLNVRILECNAEIPFLDEPVKLVFKLHFSTYDLANISRTLPGPGEFSELAPPLHISSTILQYKLLGTLSGGARHGLGWA